MALTTGEQISLFMLLSVGSGFRFQLEGRRQGPFVGSDGKPRPANSAAELAQGIKDTVANLNLGFNTQPNHWDATVAANLQMLFVAPQVPPAPAQSRNITTSPVLLAQALGMAFYDPILGCPDGKDQVGVSTGIINTVVQH